MIAKMATYIPGLTAKAFMASTMAAADCMLGPIEHIFVTEVGPDGAARNTARNVSSVSAVNVAPSGSVKTATMELGPRGVGKSTAACRASAFKQIRKLAEHIPVCKDGSSPSTLGDSSAAYTFKVLEANPKLMALAYFVDETWMAFSTGSSRTASSTPTLSSRSGTLVGASSCTTWTAFGLSSKSL